MSYSRTEGRVTSDLSQVTSVVLTVPVMFVYSVLFCFRTFPFMDELKDHTSVSAHSHYITTI